MQIARRILVHEGGTDVHEIEATPDSVFSGEVLSGISETQNIGRAALSLCQNNTGFVSVFHSTACSLSLSRFWVYNSAMTLFQCGLIITNEEHLLVQPQGGGEEDWNHGDAIYHVVISIDESVHELPCLASDGE